MKYTTFEIHGLVLIIPQKNGDNRGYFMEAFKNSWFRENIADVTFVQDNQYLSSEKGTIRRLHYQKSPFGQGTLVRVIKGSIFDVAVDISPGSATFGKWVGATLTAEDTEQLWVQEGFLHGFCPLETDCEVFYKVTNPYDKESDAGITFDDPEIGIEWPIDIKHAILSEKDKEQAYLSSLR